MPQPYNPIIRIFNRLRAGLVSGLGVARHAVRPGVSLAELIPVRKRRAVWRHLHRQGLPVPALELAPEEWSWAAVVVLKTLAAFVWWLKWPALLGLLPLGLLAYGVTRRHAVRFPAGLGTVGEMVLYLTHFPDHKDSGHRWTRSEIEFKVRLVVAEALGRPMDEVLPHKTLKELGAE
jgi:hypothetical protein